MPEVFTPDYRYQKRAQPYLAAIAAGVKVDQASRDFILKGTRYARAYRNAQPLWDQQWKERGSTKCPFWSNYCYGTCKDCNCKIDGSVSMEVDALFFFENAGRKRIAVHIEMKRDWETLSKGQAEAYRPRAECYRDQRSSRKGVLRHDHFIAVLFCGAGTDIPAMERFFDRVIAHDDAGKIFPGYPAADFTSHKGDR